MMKTRFHRVRCVQDEGLAGSYRENGKIRSYTKALGTLGYVPLSDVISSFCLLRDQDDFPDELLPVYDGFEDTYLGRFNSDGSRRTPRYPLPVWNVHERVKQGLPTTTNHIEAWHVGVLSSVNCAHPHVYAFFSILQGEETTMTANLYRALIGEAPPRKRADVQHEKNVMTLVSTYHKRPVLKFIEGLTHSFKEPDFFIGKSQNNDIPSFVVGDEF